MTGSVIHETNGTTSDLMNIGSPFILPWASKWGMSIKKRARDFGESAASFFEFEASRRIIRPRDRGSGIRSIPSFPLGLPDELGCLANRTIDLFGWIDSEPREVGVDVVLLEHHTRPRGVDVGNVGEEVPAGPPGRRDARPSWTNVQPGICKGEVSAVGHPSPPLRFGGNKTLIGSPRMRAMRACVLVPSRRRPATA